MPNLTDHDKEEIAHYLEADQLLPEKYRFLLFDEQGDNKLILND